MKMQYLVTHSAGTNHYETVDTLKEAIALARQWGARVSRTHPVGYPNPMRTRPAANEAVWIEEHWDGGN